MMNILTRRLDVNEQGNVFVGGKVSNDKIAGLKTARGDPGPRLGTNK